MADYYVDPAATGAADGSSWADAWTDFQDFWDNAANSDTCHCRGTQTLSAAITNGGLTGTAASRMTIIGYNGSGVEDGTYFTLDANSAVGTILEFTNCDYIDFRNIHLTNSTNTPTDGNANCESWYLKNCKFSNCAGSVIYRVAYVIMKQCYFLNNTYSDFYQVAGSITVECLAINAGAFYDACPDSDSIDTIVHDYTTAYSFTNSVTSVINCIVDSCTTGVLWGSSFGTLVNTRITNCTTGLNVTSAFTYTSIYSNCYFYNPGNTDIGGANSGLPFNAGDTRLTASNSSDGYANLAGHDFTLSHGNDGVEVAIPIGGTLETTNVGGITQGIPPEAAGGGGGIQLGAYENGAWR